ncbi:uncharacterized protein [Oryza sativa Japonica Group]|uniref:Os02g0492500 protein n=2 Tax=Oryza sativa subsp. japonica TaxID=39947 RepID=B9F029_ORYSJ|nr:uncharacterized protein LOC4329394 [Oryza sativa Japonica Group]EEE57020.1 hypothetical protein OsJ_06796 [Oryza sativa Japonica Group]BAD22083.1 unknown protein [Oryza sativa Japonica Group]BAF08793.1 Os02g0492500 [Oryza sativa Japonica Group]|eukprot:NP_001046879.1 Os02g0492500 [Oryza sativa Japonica Group]
MDGPSGWFLKVPPPLHTVDPPGSPPPASILLEPYGYFSDRTNHTTARGLTRGGKNIVFTFWTATPPRASFFTLHSPDDTKCSAFADAPDAVCSDHHLLLLRIPICLEATQIYAINNHYFVYHAGGDGEQRLTPVPTPPGLTFAFPNSEVVLLRRRRPREAFFLAALHRPTLCRQYTHEQFDLHLYSSETGEWSTKLMVSVDADDDDDSTSFRFSYASKAIVVGGELGTVGWVDLWHGILVCDILLDNPRLRFIPLPPPLVPRQLKGDPMFHRNIVVLEGYIKFFEMYNHTTGSASAQGWVAATKKMKISSIASGNSSSSSWEDDCAIKFSEIPVESLTFAQMLRLQPNLKQGTGTTRLTLKRLHAGYPALSLHDSDVVYIMHTPDPDEEDKALVIAVDMRNKALKGVADFGFGRPVGYGFTYLQTGISKHLSNCSSSSRDGILGAGEKEVPGEGVATAA